MERDSEMKRFGRFRLAVEISENVATQLAVQAHSGDHLHGHLELRASPVGIGLSERLVT